MQAHSEIHRPPGMPLREHSVLRSGSFDETRAFLRNKDLEIRPLRARALADGFEAAIAAAYLPRMYVAYMEYSAALEMRPLMPLDTGYGVHLPLEGWMKFGCGGETVECGAGRAAVVSPADHLSLTAGEGCKRILLSLRPDALVDHLTALLGDLPSERLVFTPDIDPTLACSRRLANAVRFAAETFELKDSIIGNDLVVTQFEQFVMTLLLMSLPNNYSEALAKDNKGVRPRDVKRAIDFIRANLGASITLEDLVAVSGVPGRTLCQHFQDFVGTSPMSYIKKARYERVREDLVSQHGEHSITEVAGRWGFSHMGRFAAEYRRRFGELPSVTAGRRKPTPLRRRANGT